MWHRSPLPKWNHMGGSFLGFVDLQQSRYILRYPRVMVHTHLFLDRFREVRFRQV